MAKKKARIRTRASASTTYPSTLGGEIAAARKRHNLSQRELAVLLGVKAEATGQAMISQWESGVRRINATPAQRAILTEVLGWQRSKLEAEIKKHIVARNEAIVVRRSAGMRKHAEELAQQLGVAATPPAPAPALPVAATDPQPSSAPVVSPDKLIDFAIGLVTLDESMRDVPHAVLRQFVLDVRRFEQRLAQLF